MIKSIIARLLTVLFLIGAVGTISGCNTVSGFGQDVERGGQKLQNEAREHRHY